MISAADWKLDEPDWTGRLKAVSKGSDVVLKLEDTNTGTLASLCNHGADASALIKRVIIIVHVK